MHMRRVRGGSCHLSIISRIGSLLLEDAEEYATESEDMVSVFKLLFLSNSWISYFVFSLRVTASVNGGNPNSWYVSFSALSLWDG